MDKIELMDESGNVEEFRIIDTFGMDDSDYAVLVLANDSESDPYILRIEYEKSGEVVLVGIGDDEEFNDAVSIYEELKNEKIQ